MDFMPTHEMLEAIENVKKCREIEELVRPIIMEYKTELLKEMQARPQEHLREYSGIPDVILNLEHVWMMEKNDYKLFKIRCAIEQINHGFTFDKGECPHLVAENDLREAQDELLSMIGEIIKIPFRELTDEAMDRYLDFLNEMLKQLVDYK